MNELIIGAWYRPTKLLKDSPEPEKFILIEFLPDDYNCVIMFEDNSTQQIQKWVVENYCRRIQDL